MIFIPPHGEKNLKENFYDNFPFVQEKICFEVLTQSFFCLPKKKMENFRDEIQKTQQQVKKTCKFQVVYHWKISLRVCKQVRFSKALPISLIATFVVE